MDGGHTLVDHPLLHGTRWHLERASSSCMVAEVDEIELSALSEDRHLCGALERFLRSIATLVRGVTSLAMTVRGRAVVIVSLDGEHATWSWIAGRS
jgi:hypothetical protein